MNTIRSILNTHIENIKKYKIKPIHKRKKYIIPIPHFEKIKHKYNHDDLYTKTINICKRPVTVFIYYEHLDIRIGVLHLDGAVSYKQMYFYITHVLRQTTVLLSDIDVYTMYAAKYGFSAPIDHIKINKHSNKPILDIILQYQSHTSYTNVTTEQMLPFLLNIIIKPIQKHQQLYINYKNNIVLCPFQECIVCLDEKYVKKICTNKHYCCFSCEKMLKRHNTKICPMCRGNLLHSF
tara:strand:+ start:144 stop:851 length:708 start_codon:yes stop_codon:yes gene_type:complete